MLHDTFRANLLVHLGSARKGLKLVLKLLYAYLAIIGLFGFSCFIFEEATQQIVFSCFSAKDANRYDLLKKNCELLEDINSHLDTVNTMFMWMQPLQMWAYGDFVKSTDQYIMVTRAMCLARDPDLFINEQINTWFKYKTAQLLPSGKWLLKSGKIVVLTNKKPEKNPVLVSGILVPYNNRLLQITPSNASK